MSGFEMLRDLPFYALSTQLAKRRDHHGSRAHLDSVMEVVEPSVDVRDLGGCLKFEAGGEFAITSNCTSFVLERVTPALGNLAALTHLGIEGRWPPAAPATRFELSRFDGGWETTEGLGPIHLFPLRYGRAD